MRDSRMVICVAFSKNDLAALDALVAEHSVPRSEILRRLILTGNAKSDAPSAKSAESR